MSTVLVPATLDELVDAVRSIPRLLPVGAGTKSRLSRVAAGVVRVSTVGLRGMREYDPSEFTFTAGAGTPLRDIEAALAERGQYLPFDPMFVDSGATLGGTVAAGLSGAGRFRFGGLRDFILGVRFVDGTGRVLRMGGKVVKNAAGFDLPKFFVGSLGRFGVLAQITFKVFPRPVASTTLRLSAATLEAAVQIMTEAANSRFEFDAIDLVPERSGVHVRLTGPAAALDALSRSVFARWPGDGLPEAMGQVIWGNLREFHWTDYYTPLVKVPLSPAAAVGLGKAVALFEGAKWHLSAGGNVAFVSLGDASQTSGFDAELRKLNLSGMVLRGDAPLWLGVRSRPEIARAVKNALDPANRFPSLDD